MQPAVNSRFATSSCHLVEKAVLWSSFCAEGPRWLLRAVTGTGVARACGHVLFKVLLNTPIHTTAYKHFKGLALPLSQVAPAVMVHRATAITIIVHTAFSRAIPDCHASRSHCRCSRPTNRTGVTVGRPSTPQFEARDKPALPQHGTARDLPIRGVTAATVGQEVRQPRRRHRQAQCIATRQL
jgi:hypothetical protein